MHRISPPVQIEMNTLEYSVDTEVADGKDNFRLGSTRRLGKEVADFPAHHLRNHALGGNLLDGTRGNVPPIADHGDPVRDIEDLFQPVRDVDDRHAFPESMTAIPRNCAASWADSAAVGSSMIRTPHVLTQRPGDLDCLLFGQRQAAGNPVDIEMHPDPVDQRMGLALQFRPVLEPSLLGRTDEDVPPRRQGPGRPSAPGRLPQFRVRAPPGAPGIAVAAPSISTPPATRVVHAGS